MSVVFIEAGQTQMAKKKNEKMTFVPFKVFWLKIAGNLKG